ncbi:MAG: TonB family protein [Candidatus Obscuribacterales bacterium]|nr:TonB family protein [Candidatus Obscuribacterales bacterium]
MLTVSNDKPAAVTKAPTVFSKPVSLEHGRWRRCSVVLANVLAPSLMCLSMSRSGAGIELLPWYVCAVGLSIFSLAQLNLQHDGDYTDLLIPAARVPIKFSETFAFSFFVIALAVFLFGLQVQPLPPAKVTQIVDIQFVSRNDATDLNSPLPGSAKTEEAQPRKRRGDEITLKGVPSPVVPRTAAAPSVPERSQPLKAKETERKKADHEQPSEKPPAERKVNQVTKPSPSVAPPVMLKTEFSASVKPAPQKSADPSDPSLVIPSSWATQRISAPPVVSMRQNRPDSRQLPYIAEVEPPELVELVENDGDSDAMKVFQRGGNSVGGKGHENGLSRYLKDLHRRIKSAWTPPKGTSRRLEVLFRINRDGTLAFAKVSQSAGEAETDRSAIAAIQSAAKRPQPLPSDYEAPYLEVLYTFNYNVDELSEVK